MMLWIKMMTKYIWIVFLSSCSLINMATYDPSEYALINDLRTEAQTLDCSKESRFRLNLTTIRLRNFVEYQPDNDQTIKLVNDLAKLVNELYISENPSNGYCKAKLHLIERNAETIQKVVGSKPHG